MKIPTHDSSVGPEKTRLTITANIFPCDLKWTVGWFFYDARFFAPVICNKRENLVCQIIFLSFVPALVRESLSNLRAGQWVFFVATLDACHSTVTLQFFMKNGKSDGNSPFATNPTVNCSFLFILVDVSGCWLSSFDVISWSPGSSSKFLIVIFKLHSNFHSSRQFSSIKLVLGCLFAQRNFFLTVIHKTKSVFLNCRDYF